MGFWKLHKIKAEISWSCVFSSSDFKYDTVNPTYLRVIALAGLNVHTWVYGSTYGIHWYCTICTCLPIIMLLPCHDCVWFVGFFSDPEHVSAVLGSGAFPHVLCHAIFVRENSEMPSRCHLARMLQEWPWSIVLGSQASNIVHANQPLQFRAEPLIIKFLWMCRVEGEYGNIRM